MIKFKSDIKGLKELEANLKALNKEYGGKSAAQAMRPAVKAALKSAEADIEANTPVDSGGLKQTVTTKIGKPSKKMLKSEHFHSNMVIAGRTGWFWKGNSHWKQALAQEFGTENQTGKAPLRNAFDANADGMIDTFKDTLGPAIEKKAKSLHKKRLKGK